jgi:uroporphyrinogen decarboxylase
MDETPRGRVLKAIRHEHPDVTPVNLGGIYGLDRWLTRFGARDEAELRDLLGVDIQSSRPVYTGELAEHSVGIFGTPVDGVFGSDGSGYSSARGGYPLAGASTVADIERFPWPDPSQFDYGTAARVLRGDSGGRALRIDMKYGIARPGKTLEECSQSGPWVPLLCTLFDLFGFETALMNLCAEPVLMEAAIRRIEEFTLEFARRSLDATSGLADIFWYGDDFATQRGMFVSPEQWRRFLKPTYRKVFTLARSYGAAVWFHSCGAFRPVLPDLVDCGMEVWETVQAHLDGNEPEGLKRDFGRDLSFYGGVSTQTTLPFGSPEAVRTEVRERVRVLGENGGYICGPDHGIMPDVPIENVLAMIDEARRYRAPTLHQASDAPGIERLANRGRPGIVGE